MKLCIPIQEDRGLESEINPHFGSADYFLVVDTESGQCRSFANRVHDQGHGHGGCNPAESLSSETINGVVVGGIGRGALLNLKAAGIEVYISNHRTAGEAVEGYKSNDLPVVTVEECCGRHGGEELHSGGHCH